MVLLFSTLHQGVFYQRIRVGGFFWERFGPQGDAGQRLGMSVVVTMGELLALSGWDHGSCSAPTVPRTAPENDPALCPQS